MRIETAIRLLKAFQTCPKCDRTMMMDDFKIDERDNGNSFELKCKCGWKLEGREE